MTKRQDVAATTTTLDSSDCGEIPDLSSGWETPEGRLEESRETPIPEPMRRTEAPNDPGLATTQEPSAPFPNEAEVDVNDSTTITHVDTEVKVEEDSPPEPGLETPGGNSGIDISEQCVRCLYINRPRDFVEDLTPSREASMFSAETSELQYELLLEYTRWRTHSAPAEDAIYYLSLSFARELFSEALANVSPAVILEQSKDAASTDIRTFGLTL